jgi:hypothetical protein
MSIILDKLRLLARNSKCSLLDRSPHLDRPVFVAFECYFCLPSKSYFLDLPLKNILGLNHHNFFNTGQTWHQILYPSGEKSGLTCEGWSSRVYEYFDGEWRDSPFSHYASNCMGGARFTAVGGAVTVSNGMHRVVGGYIYRAATLGENALFSKVRVRYCELMPEVKKFLKGLKTSHTLFIGRTEIVCATLWTTSRLQKTETTFAVSHRFRPFNALFLKYRLNRVPSDLLSYMLDDTLLTTAESAPDYAG